MRRFTAELEHAARMELDARAALAVDVAAALAGGDALTKHLRELKRKG